ncbi:MAG: LytTR family transcriptional regulator DNA-binding domain-containing protein [Erysipelotrichaceae bacterium]|nr:LytTR family transcriptional regulator DNA-binding domain-containing protein [Erysipelotrichaceae bacterium]
MNFYIVDDDRLFSQKLKKDINLYFNDLDDLSITIISESFEKILDVKMIDVIFLDVDLNTSYTGLNLATYIQHNFPNVILIFISNHEEFVFPALSYNIFQFIRKNNYDNDLNTVLSQLNKHLLENNKKIIIQQNGRKTSIQINEIKFIMVMGHDLFIKTINNDYTIVSSLKKFMEQINNIDFIQIQKNVVINFNYAKEVKKTKVILIDNQEFNVGRIYKQNLMSQYEEFLLK